MPMADPPTLGLGTVKLCLMRLKDSSAEEDTLVSFQIFKL